MFGNCAKNKKNWKQTSVQELVDKGTLEKPLDGNHGEKHPVASDYVNEGIPFIMANNLFDGKVDYSSCYFIKSEQAEKLDKGFAKPGDVLITHKGTIGRTAIVDDNFDYIMLTPQVTYYRIKNSLNKTFLKSYFDSSYFQTVMAMLALAQPERILALRHRGICRYCFRLLRFKNVLKISYCRLKNLKIKRGTD